MFVITVGESKRYDFKTEYFISTISTYVVCVCMRVWSSSCQCHARAKVLCHCCVHADKHGRHMWVVSRKHSGSVEVHAWFPWCCSCIGISCAEFYQHYRFCSLAVFLISHELYVADNIVFLKQTTAIYGGDRTNSVTMIISI